MDRNTLLAFVLSMAIFTVWLMYQSGRQEEMGDASRQGLQSSSEAFDTTRQIEAAAGEPELGRQAAGPRDTLPSPAPAPLLSGSQHPLWEGRIEAERYTAELSSLGGGLRGWTLSNYFAVARRGSMGEREPIRLINPPASHPVALRTRFR